jgi:hypothetical protein
VIKRQPKADYASVLQPAFHQREELFRLKPESLKK